MDFKTIQCQWLNQDTIFHLKLNRPKKLNAMNGDFFDEIQTLFQLLDKSANLRCVLITANGGSFCAGLDLNYAGPNLFNLQEVDIARKAIRILNIVKHFQKSMSVLEDCRVPVLIGVHGMCVGGGIDLISAADLRYCTTDAKFSIKEIDIGVAADIGTLQRVPLKCGNDSLFRELAYTGRFFDAEEAKYLGLVSKVYQSYDDMYKSMFNDAVLISEKSPVGIWANKRVLTNDFKKRYGNTLDYVSALNSSIGQTSDSTEAIKATMAKTKPIFPKL